MFSNEIPDERVEKMMSFTEAEFETGLRRLTGSAIRKTSDGHYDLSDAAEGLLVSCSFEPLPSAQLSPLMRLPRVKVMLDMSNLGDTARAEFLLRFEKTFQRGGG